MTEDTVVLLIRSHVQRYPDMDIQDVYKLLHQGVFGPGHTVTNIKAAREWLEKEAEQEKPDGTELLIESVHPEGRFVRLHLRPYLAVHGDLRKLLDAYVRTAQNPVGDSETMARWWGIFQRLTDVGGVMANRFSARTVSLVGRTRAGENWPTSHHSPPYDRAYRPVYRVLDALIAQELLRGQKIVTPSV